MECCRRCLKDIVDCRRITGNMTTVLCLDLAVAIHGARFCLVCAQMWLTLNPNDKAGTRKLLKDAYELHSEILVSKDKMSEHVERLKEFGRRNCRKVQVKIGIRWSSIHF
jgi:hypothetical protein